MNKETVEGQWKQLVGSVKEKWGDLTDDEILEVKGKREQLAGKIQERYGKSKEEAEKQIDEWSKENNHKW